MSGFWVLLRKEFREQFKTNKVIIVAAVFLFFGLGTPLLTKYTPELIESLGTGGITIEMPTPTSSDSLVEYAGTMAQFGVLMAVLVGMGAIAKEVETGTAAMVLSKPVGRLAFILAKLKAGGFTFMAALVLGGLACWGYTVILFGDANVIGFLYQNLLLGLFFRRLPGDNAFLFQPDEEPAGGGRTGARRHYFPFSHLRPALGGAFPAGSAYQLGEPPGAEFAGSERVGRGGGGGGTYRTGCLSHLAEPEKKRAVETLWP